MGVTQGQLETAPFRQEQSDQLRERLGALRSGFRPSEKFFPGALFMLQEFEVMLENLEENVFYIDEKSKQVALSMGLDLLSNWLKFQERN